MPANSHHLTRLFCHFSQILKSAIDFVVVIPYRYSICKSWAVFLALIDRFGPSSGPGVESEGGAILRRARFRPPLTKPGVRFSRTGISRQIMQLALGKVICSDELPLM